MNTPILLITFNRPNHTRKVLERILEAKPQALYVFQDGAREDNDNDAVRCAEVRQVIDTLWTNYLSYAVAENEKQQPRLHRYYSDINLGCGPGPVTAISWFFEHVEMGIVMEDDCLAHPDFFPYCEELLIRYQKDNCIGFIGGCNYQDGQKHGNGSYYFSMGHHGTWGWASWQRVWNQFDYNLDSITEKEFASIIRYYGRDPRFIVYWEDMFARIKKDRMNDSAWDYQFYFSCWKHHQLAIMPNVNLVSNIGDGIDATHTNGLSPMLYTMIYPILPLNHPVVVKQDCRADMYFHRTYIQSYDYGWRGLKRLPYRLNKCLKKILGHEGSWIKKK